MFCFNWGDAQALRGWAIPTATDIAFALGVLSLLGPRVPPSLRIFLLAVAIIDDLGAILIIALFYTGGVSWIALALAALAGSWRSRRFNLTGVTHRAPYILGGIFLWVCVLKSGIHATLAGVVVGIAVPLRTTRAGSPLIRLEHDLHPWVAFGVLPAFAFANAGVTLAGITIAELLHPVELGVVFGLIIGKPLGVAAFGLGGNPFRVSQIAGGRRMAPDLRSGSAYRDWLYDEPVYRRPRLSGGRLQRRHPHRRVDRLVVFGDLRLPVAAEPRVSPLSRNRR